MKIYVINLMLGFLFITSCIDPYQINSKGEGKYLIVDGLVTNREGPYSVLLTYSTPRFSPINEKVTNASVKIIDDTGEEHHLIYQNDGKYQTNPDFRAKIGKSYRLLIENDSKRYESDLCLLREPSCIDNISIQKKTKPGEYYKNDVLQLKVDASICSDKETCLRWDVNEDWKIHLRNPDYFYMVDDTTFGWHDDVIKECYKYDKIEGIVIKSFQNQAEKIVTDKLVASISTYTSDRFFTRYRATINQYSISPKEYSFWNRLKETSEEQEDFFGKQPYSVYGNVKCIDNPEEQVLGYFQVAGVASREIYIGRGDISNLGLGVYSYEPCAVDTLFASDEYSIYEKYLLKIRSDEWVLSSGFYKEESLPPTLELLGVVFIGAECGKCSRNNARVEPPMGWME
ncbi:DUF4249 domain-containing protein [Labilibacter marinus]|uniref:DUF4249 domain-containing protein n=1 Tax=Labilibacter marinus TaxID=1477105 RepID=UPI00094F7114|nr:DUF4249 domain-containing protein [Labilibacter marinus]